MGGGGVGVLRGYVGGRLPEHRASAPQAGCTPLQPQRHCSRAGRPGDGVRVCAQAVGAAWVLDEQVSGDVALLPRLMPAGDQSLPCRADGGCGLRSCYFTCTLVRRYVGSGCGTCDC